jgi:hypothetical protein
MIQKLFFSLISLLVFYTCLVANDTQAQEVYDAQARLSYWLPNDWRREGENDAFKVTEPNGEAVVIFLVTEAAGIEASLVRLDAELVKIVTNKSQVNKPEETSINNLRAIVLDGTGRIDGELTES